MPAEISLTSLTLYFRIHYGKAGLRCVKGTRESDRPFTVTTELEFIEHM